MNVKSFLHSWCSKLGVTPFFHVRVSEFKTKQTFFCELKVKGYPYTGCGSSTNKKDAQFNAARDFIQYLVRKNIIDASEVPSGTFQSTNGQFRYSGGGVKARFSPSTPIKPGFQSEMRPDWKNEFYHPYKEASPNHSYTYIDRIADQKEIQEAEPLDVDADIHGNWTIENGKPRLHQFLQQHNIKADYKYSVIGSENSPIFVAKMNIYLKKLNRTLTGCECASNKASASKSCALSLVRQLYHLGVIEAFSGTLKKNRDRENKMKPYPVAISPELEARIHDVLNTLKIEPTRLPKELAPKQKVSILNSTVLDEFISSKPQSEGVVDWSPPMENWNAWTSCNIDKGRLAQASLDEISRNLEKSLRQKIQKDRNLQKILREREALPAVAMRKEILQTIKDNPVIIIRGNTGCGKTTQVCQFILDDYIQAGRGAHCNIIITQPRKISAVSVADRVAFERSEALGNSVGYSVRFESVLPRPFGSILFCTVGVLLKKLENGLKGVSHMIVDEIHERHLTTDFLLVVLRDAVRTYPDLRVVLMSATVDTTLFSDYFDKCSVVEIPSRSYPVEEYFLEDCIQMLKFMPPLETKKKKSKNSREEEEDDEAAGTQQGDELEENLNNVSSNDYLPETKIAMSRLNEKEISFELIEELLNYIRSLKVPGAVLIFLPGWSLIFALMEHLQQNPVFNSSDYVILPLHSLLPGKDQRRVFEVYPENVTKVIISTNIAETSITINDVVFVIDSCKTRVISHTHNNMISYATGWASKTNLKQRKGRAGRVRPGMCFYLCSKARYQKFDEYMTPEILRAPLHELALAVKMLRLGSVGQFLSKVVEPPPADAVIEAEVLLREIKCLDSNDELTPLGRILGRLPIEPRLGKMMVLGCLFHCGNALATIAANSSVSSEIFTQVPGKRRLTYEQKSFAGNRYSDHIAMLNAFGAWEEARMIDGQAEEKLCKTRMLSVSGMRMTWKTKNQLLQLMTEVTGFPKETMTPQVYDFNGVDPNLDVVVALLCSGLYPNVAYHLTKRKVLTTGSKVALIHKSSVNCSNFEQTFPMPFFVYGEKIRSGAVACKQMSMVTPIHLLLFGARKVEYVNKLIKLDGWIVLDIKPEMASAIVALRPALESLIIKASKDPTQVTDNSQVHDKIINVTKQLCELNAGRYGMEPLDARGFAPERPPSGNCQVLGAAPPRKVPRLAPG